MKYILFSILALALCIAAGIAAASWFARRKKRAGKAVSSGRRILLAGSVSLLLLGSACLGYFQIYCRAAPEAEAYLESSGSVTVSETEKGWFFDGPGTDSAVVFYPGGKVDAAAYAPLLFGLAERGEDCFLVEMPLRMALFDQDAAADLIASADYGYDSWYLMGHSLGGVVAAGYAAEHPEDVDGVILLAAYPNVDVPDSLRLLSIYGTEDGCLERDAYKQGRENGPKDAAEQVIAGGNHAQFGDYGAQKGDGEASISPEEQRQETIDGIGEWLSR